MEGSARPGLRPEGSMAPRDNPTGPAGRSSPRRRKPTPRGTVGGGPAAPALSGRGAASSDGTRIFTMANQPFVVHLFFVIPPGFVKRNVALTHDNSKKLECSHFIWITRSR